MGTDWNAPRDVGPTAKDWDDSDPKRKRKKADKPYGIEAKFLRGFQSEKWRIWKWYETAKRRDEAMAQLVKSKSTMYGRPWMEFRACNKERIEQAD